MRFIRLLAILGVSGLGPGCGLVDTGTANLVGETRIALIHHQLLDRARQQADEAWKQVGSRAGTTSSKDYERGFKEGFVRTVWWGPEEAPAIPPRGYWSARFRSPEGDAAVADWAEGFRNGVSAALHSGVSLSVKLPATALHPGSAAAPGPGSQPAPLPPAWDTREAAPRKDTEVLPPPRPVPPTPEKDAGAAKTTSSQGASKFSGPPPAVRGPLPAPSLWTRFADSRPNSEAPSIMPCAVMEPLQPVPPVAQLGRPQ